MNRREFLTRTGMGAAAMMLPAGLPVAAASAQHDKPNIVVIMADDMGFSDVGCYGGEVQTPNLDRLAAGGLRFSQFYNAARCCPTRASLLTGLYPHQAGVGAMVSPNDDRPGYRGRLNESCVTLAEVLRGAGYATYLSGKWHVSHYQYQNPEATLHPGTWPLQRGFDRFFGTLAGAGSFFAPVSLMRDNDFIAPGDDFYYTDAINDEAARFIAEADADKPLFLYAAHVAPHWPLHALPEDIERYKEVYRVGWDALRAERHERLIDLGLIDPAWSLTRRDARVPAWEDAEHKEWEIHRMAVYAAQVDRMDQGIGRIVDALEQSGRLENTLILFLSDNGASDEVIQGRETRHGYFERGGTTPEVFPGGPDTYASYGHGWANASNAPFRRYKKWIHEGGAATPLVAHWPAGIAERGGIRHQVGHIIDFMATFVDMAGAVYPEAFNGHAITPMEGVSLLPAFADRPLERTAPLFWEHLGNRGMRDGNWKLVAGDDAPWELYDMERDRTETNNLSDAHPERVAAMNAAYDAWAARVGV